MRVQEEGAYEILESVLNRLREMDGAFFFWEKKDI